jgi:thiol-disulfide isomerase/thioredoxin
MQRSLLRLLLLAVSSAAFLSTHAAGGVLDLGPYQGKVVMLDFWASWCGPCAESFPWMAEMQEKYGAQGLVVVAVNLDEDQDAAAAFLGKHRAGFHHLSDPGGAIAESVGVQVMPTSILYDRQGRPAFVHSGFHAERRAEYEQHLVAVLQGRAEGDAAVLSGESPGQGWLGVHPWQRGILAQEDMRLDCAPLDLAADEHIYFSKEASSGGRGFGGGGCGCN